MPVYKFKTFEEARKHLTNKPDENYYKMLSDFYETFGKLFKKKFPHGVYKFKTIEEAQKQKRIGYLISFKKPIEDLKTSQVFYIFFTLKY